MTTADYALIVSICSAAVSLFGLGWAVWSKFIYPKPDLRVSFYTAAIIQGDDDPKRRPKYLAISFTNHGPADVIVQSAVVVLQSRPFAERRHAMINPIHNIHGDPLVGVGPFGGGLPKKLAVGEGHTLYFPFTADSFARERMVSVGVYDNFNRTHRCRRKHIKQVKDDLNEAFPAQPVLTG